MRRVKELAVLLTGCGGAPAEETPAESGTEPPAGQITLYGEIHGNAAIKEYEAERWKECYDQGMRHLFVELPYDNYPIPIEAGQVFVIDYTRKDGTSERKYYRSDEGEQWNGMDCTTEFIPE